jgi:hypothetical protein
MPRFCFVLLSALFGAALAAPSAHAEVTLHLYAYEGEQVDAVIDWGSSQANAECQRIVKGAGQSVTCSPAATSDRIRISGVVPQFGPGAAAPTGNTVSRVVSWGNVNLKSLDGAFRGNTRLTAVPNNVPPTIRNLNRTFQDATAFAQDLSGWGMSLKNVQTMTDLFDGALAQLTDMSKWCMKNFEEEPPGLLGRTNDRAPRIKDFVQRQPRLRECGVTLPDGLPTSAPVDAFFSFDLRSGIEVWANAPDGTSVAQMIFEVTSGALPPGLTLDRNTGEISGTPNTPGQYAFQIRARQY